MVTPVSPLCSILRILLHARPSARLRGGRSSIRRCGRGVLPSPPSSERAINLQATWIAEGRGYKVRYYVYALTDLTRDNTRSTSGRGSTPGFRVISRPP
jgi:hypothetical protein